MEQYGWLYPTQLEMDPNSLNQVVNIVDIVTKISFPGHIFLAETGTLNKYCFGYQLILLL